MKVGLIQQENTADRTANIEKLKVNIRKIAREGTELATLQELHNGLYFCQAGDTSTSNSAEMIPGPSMEILGTLAKELGIVSVFSLFEKRVPGSCHNTAVVLERDSTITGKYRKIHTLDGPAYYEKLYFTPGDLGFEPIDTSVGCLGVLVCWDQWHPEATRLVVMHDVGVLIYPTIIGWGSSDTQGERDRQLGAWATIQWEHAVANGPPVIPANRIEYGPDLSGQTDGIRFWESGLAAGPQGELLIAFPNDEEKICVIEIDRTRSENVRH